MLSLSRVAARNAFCLPCKSLVRYFHRPKATRILYLAKSKKIFFSICSQFPVLKQFHLSGVCLYLILTKHYVSLVRERLWTLQKPRYLCKNFQIRSTEHFRSAGAQARRPNRNRPEATRIIRLPSFPLVSCRSRAFNTRGNKSSNRRISLSRSQYGGCSTAYNTSTSNQVVCK